MKQARINLFAGPGAGKSTTAHWIMWKLKSSGYVADYCREWVKDAAYEGIVHPQSVIFDKQYEEELRALRTGGIVVTDSPLLLQAVYALKGSEERGISIFASKDLSIKYPTLNLFIERGDRPYIKAGRWQTHEEAKVKDDEIRQLLLDTNTPFRAYMHDDYEGIWSSIGYLLSGMVPA